MSISQRTSFIIIIVLHTITYSTQQGYLQSGQCEPIRIPMCQSMPWNETKMPNLMDQTSQQNAILKIEEYAPLGKFLFLFHPLKKPGWSLGIATI